MQTTPPPIRTMDLTLVPGTGTEASHFKGTEAYLEQQLYSFLKPTMEVGTTPHENKIVRLVHSWLVVNQDAYLSVLHDAYKRAFRRCVADLKRDTSAKGNESVTTVWMTTTWRDAMDEYIRDNRTPKV